MGTAKLMLLLDTIDGRLVLEFNGDANDILMTGAIIAQRATNCRSVILMRNGERLDSWLGLAR